MTWSSTLATDISDTDGTIRLTSPLIVRRSSNFLTIESEVIEVRGGAETLYVLRGVMGTEAVAHTAGAVVGRYAAGTAVVSGDGAPGQQGPIGEQGPVGEQGPIGEQGPVGDKGPQGDPGPDGAPGADGSPGVAGADGADGAAGQAGATGDKGPVGDKGPTGDQGPVGEQGPVGDAGQGGEAFPIGAVFLAVVSTDPGTLFGYGTWTAFGAGRMLVGRDGNDADFDTAEETGGAKTVTLTAAQSGTTAHGHAVTDPGHTHVQQRFPTATGGSTGFTVDTSMSGTPAAANATASGTTGLTVNNASAAGAAEAHNNLPPYIVVYMWKRTA
jgi:microcystin-dependent protein